MAVKLKRELGEGGALIGDSSGQPNLYDVLVAIANTQNDLVTQFNQLRTDYLAIPQSTTATAVVPGVEVE